MDLITPEIGLIFWSTVSFAILFFILAKFAWKPILTSVNDRENSIKEALASAEEAKKEMENLHLDNQKLIKEARMERDVMMKEALEIKETIISEAKDEAKEVATKLIQNAQTVIEQEKQAALAELKKQVSDLSIGIAESILKKELNSKDDQLKLVEEILEEVTLN